MATTVSYKGSTIATVSNNTKTLETEGKYLEADIILTDNTHITTLQSKSVTPTESAQAVIPDSGYDGLSQVDVGAISSTYVGSGVSRQAAQTIYPNNVDQTISQNTYLTGTQTIKGVTTSNIIAGNIKKDVVVEVGDTDDSDRVLSVTGTYEGEPVQYTRMAHSVVPAYPYGSYASLAMPVPDSSSRITSAVAIFNQPYNGSSTGRSAIALIYNSAVGAYYEMLDLTSQPLVSYQQNGIEFDTETNTFIFPLELIPYGSTYDCIFSYDNGQIPLTVHTMDIYPESGVSSLTFNDLIDDDGSILYFSCMLGDSLGMPDNNYYRTIGVTGINTGSDWWTFGSFYPRGNPDVSRNQLFTADYSDHTLTINALNYQQQQNATGYFHSGVYQLMYVTSTNPYQTKKITQTNDIQVIYADSDKEALNYVTIDGRSYGQVYTPTATKGTVSNGTIKVTPKVTYSAGYIDSGTVTGTAVTVYANELVSGTETKTANGTYDVTNLSRLVVNVSNGGSPYGGLDLLATLSLGTISTSSTSATNTNKSVSVPNVNDYDLLIVETTVATRVNDQHLGTTNLIWLTASSNISAKNVSAISTATWNVKTDSSGIATTRSSTTKYGIYANSCTVSSGTATIPMYQRYNSTQTGTINGNYTTKVYGVRIYTLVP